VLWRIAEGSPLPILAGLLARIVVKAAFSTRKSSHDARHHNSAVVVVAGLAFSACVPYPAQRGPARGRHRIRPAFARIAIGVVGSGSSPRCCRKRWSPIGLGPIQA